MCFVPVAAALWCLEGAGKWQHHRTFLLQNNQSKLNLEGFGPLVSGALHPQAERPCIWPLSCHWKTWCGISVEQDYWTPPGTNRAGVCWLDASCKAWDPIFCHISTFDSPDGQINTMVLISGSQISQVAKVFGTRPSGCCVMASSRSETAKRRYLGRMEPLFSFRKGMGPNTTLWVIKIMPKP